MRIFVVVFGQSVKKRLDFQSDALGRGPDGPRGTGSSSDGKMGFSLQSHIILVAFSSSTAAFVCGSTIKIATDWYRRVPSQQAVVEEGEERLEM